MRRRCYQCKCLQEESTAQYVLRTKNNLNARFYCRSCKRKIIPEIQEQVKEFSLASEQAVQEKILLDKENRKIYNSLESTKQIRRRYLSNDINRQYDRRIKRLKSNRAQIHARSAHLSDQEKQAIGRFYRKCPQGYQIDYIVPLSQGGRHELANLQYLSIHDHRNKTAKELGKRIKNEIYESGLLTSTPERIEEIKLPPLKRNRVSKFKRMRRLKVN